MREEQDELSAQYADSLDQVHTSFAKELGALRAADQAAADAALLGTSFKPLSKIFKSTFSYFLSIKKFGIIFFSVDD